MRRKAASLLYMMTQMKIDVISSRPRLGPGDTVIVPDHVNDTVVGEKRGWKIGTIIDTKDDDNIVQEYSQVRIRAEDNMEMIRYLSDVILIQRDVGKSSKKVSTIVAASSSQQSKSSGMCVCCDSSSAFHKNAIQTAKLLSWRVARLQGLRVISDVLISSSESTLNEVSLKLLVNLLRVGSNSSLLPRTSAGKPAFAPIMSRLLDPSASQRSTAAEAIKSVLKGNVRHHEMNVTQLTETGIQPLLMLILKWVQLMKNEKLRRKQEQKASDRQRRRRMLEMRTGEAFDMENGGCCVPICGGSSSSSSFPAKESKNMFDWHGKYFVRVGEVRDQARHNAVIASAAAAAVSTISGVLSLTSIEKNIKNDMEEVDRMENELGNIFNNMKSKKKEKDDLENEDEDTKKKKKNDTQFSFETSVGPALRRAFFREKVRISKDLKSEEDLKKTLIELPSFRISAVSSDFGTPLERIPASKLKEYAEMWALELDPFRVLQNSILAAWAVEIDLDQLNDTLTNALILVNRFTEIALCVTSVKMSSSSYSNYSAFQVLMWALWTSCNETKQDEEKRREIDDLMSRVDESVKSQYDTDLETCRNARKTIFEHASKALCKICSVKNVGILLRKVVRSAKRSVVNLEYTQFLIRSKSIKMSSSSEERNLMSIYSWISKKNASIQTLIRSTMVCFNKLEKLHDVLQSSINIGNQHITLPIVLSRAMKRDNTKGESARCLVQFLLNNASQQTRLLQQQGVDLLLPLCSYIISDEKVMKLFEQLSMLFGTARTALVRRWRPSKAFDIFSLSLSLSYSILLFHSSSSITKFTFLLLGTS